MDPIAYTGRCRAICPTVPHCQLRVSDETCADMQMRPAPEIFSPSYPRFFVFSQLCAFIRVCQELEALEHAKSHLHIHVRDSMDPLSALSIVGNLIQFVDFSSKLFKESRKIYYSATGASSEIRTLGSVSVQLAALSKSFTEEDLKSLNLKDVAIQCHGVAKELQVLVDRLKLKTPSQRYLLNVNMVNMEV